MHAGQLERLKKHSKQLQHNVYRLNKKGRSDLAHKMQRKQQYLSNHILELNDNQ